MKQPDLNLLIYLDLLIKHGSVTRVAQELGVSQPGVSAALRRLRAVLQDPVLVRTGGGMVPTAKARAVQAQVAGALGLWARLADGDLVFDPARTTRSYSLLASDYIQFLLLPGLAREMARQAPQGDWQGLEPGNAAVQTAKAMQSERVGTIFVASGNWSAMVPLQFGGDGEQFFVILHKLHKKRGGAEGVGKRYS